MNPSPELSPIQKRVDAAKKRLVTASLPAVRAALAPVNATTVTANRRLRAATKWCERESVIRNQRATPVTHVQQAIGMLVARSSRQVLSTRALVRVDLSHPLGLVLPNGARLTRAHTQVHAFVLVTQRAQFIGFAGTSTVFGVGPVLGGIFPLAPGARPHAELVRLMDKPTGTLLPVPDRYFPA